MVSIRPRKLERQEMGEAPMPERPKLPGGAGPYGALIVNHQIRALPVMAALPRMFCRCSLWTASPGDANRIVAINATLIAKRGRLIRFSVFC